MNLKKSIYEELRQVVEQKIELAQKAVNAIKESRDSDTKSSAGDKFETGRAIMQAELDRHKTQLNNALLLKTDLLQINIQREHQKVGLGSLVETDQASYFISVGLGKVEVDGQPYYAISSASPIGQLLYEKTSGDRIYFQDKETIITNIE